MFMIPYWLTVAISLSDLVFETLLHMVIRTYSVVRCGIVWFNAPAPPAMTLTFLPFDPRI